MALQTWTLVDVEAASSAPDATFLPENGDGPARGCSVSQTVLRGGLREGVRAVEVNNGSFRFVVLPDRGMGLWKGWLGDVELGWKSPVKGPVNPAFVPIWEESGLGWLSGFDELLCRCGLESNGAPDRDDNGRLKYPLHGKIANTPAHRVDVSIDDASGEIAVSGIVDEARMYHNKLRMKSTVRTRAGLPGLTVVDEVTNLSAENGELQLVYHINFGQPLLDPGSRFVAPIRTLVPRDARAAEGVAAWDTYGQEQPGFTEQVYFMELAAGEDGRTQTLLRNAHGNQGVSLHFNKKQLPCFTLWKSTQAASDGYVTGLEPGINFPNPRSYEKEHARVATLKPGQTLRFEIELEVHATAESVSQAEQNIAALQGAVKPRIFERPMPRWTSAAEG